MFKIIRTQLDEKQARALLMLAQAGHFGEWTTDEAGTEDEVTFVALDDQFAIEIHGNQFSLTRNGNPNFILPLT